MTSLAAFGTRPFGSLLVSTHSNRGREPIRIYVRPTIIRVNSGIGLAVDEQLDRAMKFPRAEEAF